MKRPPFLLPLLALAAAGLARGSAADGGGPPNPFEGEPNPNLEFAPPPAVPPVPRATEACDAPETAEAPHPLADGVYWDATVAVKYRVENGEATILEDLSLSRSRSALDLPDRLGGASVVAIGDSAFEKCGSLRSVSLPASLRMIGNRAFSNCGSLRSLELPASLREIGDWAFCSCRHLETVSFPSGLRAIGNDAFRDCRRLAAADLPEGLESIGAQAFHACRALRTVSFPSTLAVADGFSECTALEAVALPDTVRRLGSHAFYLCTALRSFDSGEGLESVPGCAFLACGSLSSVRLGPRVGSIAADAFGNCSSLRELSLPASVTNFSYHAFGMFGPVPGRILVDPANPVYARAPDGGIYERATGNTVCAPDGAAARLVVPEGTETIRDAQYSSGPYSSVVLPASLRQIENAGFYLCTNLASIVVPDSVGIVGPVAFCHCASLTNAVLGAGVETLRWGAFGECNALETLRIGPALRTIEEDAFPARAPRLRLELDPANPHFRLVDGALCSADGRTLVFSPAPRGLAIPAGVTNIAHGAIRPASVADARLEVPDGVERIGAYAFAECAGLREVVLPDSVREIGVGAFRSCPDLETVVIGAGVADIAEDAFSRCPRLAAVRIAAPKPHIGRNAFWHWNDDDFRPAREEDARAPAVFEVGGAPSALRPYQRRFYCGGIIGPEDEEE